MEPLPIGWRKDRYTWHEALRIVAWRRYGGPHPGTDAKPSREARANATRDLKPVVRSEPIAATPRAQAKQSNWVTNWRNSEFYRPGWELEPRRTSATHIRAPVNRSWIDRSDLEALCPGLFHEPNEQPKPEATGLEIVGIAADVRRMEAELRERLESFKAAVNKPLLDESKPELPQWRTPCIEPTGDRPPRKRTPTTRNDPLADAIRTAREELLGKLGREPTAGEVFKQLARGASESGPVVDFKDDPPTLVWIDSRGKVRDTKLKTLSNRLPRIRMES